MSSELGRVKQRTWCYVPRRCHIWKEGTSDFRFQIPLSILMEQNTIDCILLHLKFWIVLESLLLFMLSDWGPHREREGEWVPEEGKLRVMPSGFCTHTTFCSRLSLYWTGKNLYSLYPLPPSWATEIRQNGAIGWKEERKVFIQLVQEPGGPWSWSWDATQNSQPKDTARPWPLNHADWLHSVNTQENEIINVI